MQTRLCVEMDPPWRPAPHKDSSVLWESWFETSSTSAASRPSGCGERVEEAVAQHLEVEGASVRRDRHIRARRRGDGRGERATGEPPSAPPCQAAARRPRDRQANHRDLEGRGWTEDMDGYFRVLARSHRQRLRGTLLHECSQPLGSTSRCRSSTVGVVADRVSGRAMASNSGDS